MTALLPDVQTDLREENARLARELRAARDRQAGSAEILRTIGSVSGDAQQSLHQIAETTKRLFEASSVSNLSRMETGGARSSTMARARSGSAPRSQWRNCA